MTTSPETEHLNHGALRQILHEADALTQAERLTLLKGLIPGVARGMSPRDFEAFVVELRLKGERFYEASLHPGQGKADRSVIGERDLEGR